MSKILCFKLGKGSNINFWEDPWVPNLPNFNPIPKNETVRLRQGMVHSLLKQNGDWNLTMLNEMFNTDSVKRICEIFWANMEEDDSLVWLENKNGVFSVKSFYCIENWAGETQLLWLKKTLE